MKLISEQWTVNSEQIVSKSRGGLRLAVVLFSGVTTLTVSKIIRRLTYLSFVLILSTVHCPLSTRAEASEILYGKLTAVEGAVDVRKLGGEDWIAAFPGMTIGPGDQLATGIDGVATLDYDNSTSRVGPLTQFIVGRSVDQNEGDYTELFLKVGKVVSKVTRAEGGRNRFNVITPVSVVGVRGTQQSVGHFPGQGTSAAISDGTGYMAALPENKLPSAARVVLGVDEEEGKGGDEGDEGKDEGGKDEAKEDKGDKAPKGKLDKKKKDKKKKFKAGTEEDDGEESDKDQYLRLAEAGDASAEAGAGASSFDMTPELAMEAFQEWLVESMDAIAAEGGSDAGADMSEADQLIDDRQIDDVLAVPNGTGVEIDDNPDLAGPAGITAPAELMDFDFFEDVGTPGTTPAEEEALTFDSEGFDEPPSTAIAGEQSTFQELEVQAVTESTEAGGLPPNIIKPPAFPF